MANTTWSATDLANVTLSGTNNLIVTDSGAAQGGVRTIDRQVTGKFYWENTITMSALNTHGVGIANQKAVLGGASGIWNNSGLQGSYLYNSAAGQIYINGALGPTLGVTIANGNVIGIAVDLAARLIWYRVSPSGNWNGNAANNPATGVGGIDISAVAGGAIPIYPMACFGTTGTRSVTANFGDTAFSGAVPSGFTSGFTSGASIPSNEIATQLALEEWAQAIPPQLWATQLAVEEWVSTNVTNPRMVATQIAIEQWATVAQLVAVPQARAMILA